MATVCGQRMNLVGTEGCAEIEGEAWYHQASKEEQARFFQYIESTLAGHSRNSPVQDLLVDGTNRPYWLLVIHDDAPRIAGAKSEEYVRVLRVHTD